MSVTDDVEASWTNARRRANGSEFLWHLVPPEFTNDRCKYKNPGFDLEVLFEARWIYDNAIVGIILMEGRLRERIGLVAGQRLSSSEIDDLVRDCHELIVEQIRWMGERRGLQLHPHVYEAMPSRFVEISPPVQVNLDAVAISQAVQVK